MSYFGRLELIRNGAALDLNDIEHYAVLNYDGFGIPPLHRLTERGPLQHGVSDRGYRLDPRLIQIILNLRAANWTEMYARRQELLGYLTPAGEPDLALRITLPDGSIRQIDVTDVDGPTYARADALAGKFQKAAIRLMAADPAWYDPVRQSVRVVGATGGSGFAFPLTVPWTFGGTTVSATVNLNYPGTWLEYPEIVITGPVSDARIEHVESGNVLDLDGTVIDEGDHYTIDLRYGYKTVVDAAGANKIADLTPESDLAIWALQPGTNTIEFGGVSAGENTSIILRWYNRYLGV